MRGAKATHLFEYARDIALVYWRLRIESFVASQPARVKERIRLLASSAPVVLPQCIRWLRAGVPPTLWPQLLATGAYQIQPV